MKTKRPNGETGVTVHPNGASPEDRQPATFVSKESETAVVVRPEPAIKAEPPDAKTGAWVHPNGLSSGEGLLSATFEFVSVNTELPGHTPRDSPSPTTDEESSPLDFVRVKDEPKTWWAEGQLQTEPADSSEERGGNLQVNRDNCIRPMHGELLASSGDDSTLCGSVCSEQLGDPANNFEGVHVNVVPEEGGNRVTKYQETLKGRKPLEKHLCFSARDLFQCGICQKRFGQSSNLLRHSRIHTGEKPYRCDRCPKQFNDPSHLTRHSKTHTRANPHQCNTCQQFFPRKSDLVTHMKGHSGERMYECNVCQRGFTQSSNLARHRVVHTGEKPYECKLCNKQYNDRSHLARHNRVHVAGSESYILRKQLTNS